MESLWVIKAQRAGHAVRAAAAWPALCLNIAQQEAGKYILVYVPAHCRFIRKVIIHFELVGHYLRLASTSNFS